MAYSNGQPMEPPFTGFVKTTGDALLLFEAARTSVIPRVTRRLTDTERHHMIKSGAVFIWNEQECRIRRWTDAMTWSPSRIIGNFLVYRETTERGSGRSPAARAARLAKRSRESNLSTTSSRQPPPDETPEQLAQRTHERSIVGSLADDLGTFKPGGLVKKTMSLVIDGISHHLVSYYNPDDVKADKLPTPSSLPHISAVGIPPDLLDRRLGFSQPPRVELVNGVITYAGESADDAPLQRQESASKSPEAGPSLPRAASDPSPTHTINFGAQLAFFDAYAGASGSPYDVLTMPTLRIPQFDVPGDASFILEPSPKYRNPSRKLSLASHRHEPYPSSSASRSARRKLSVSPESSAASPSNCQWSYSAPNTQPRPSDSFNDGVDYREIARLGQSISYGPYSAPASISGYSHLVENSFPEYFPSFSPTNDAGISSDSGSVSYSHQYTHPHSPPPTPRTDAPSPPPRPSLTVDTTELEHRFAYSCPPTASAHHEALVTPPPTACTDPSLSSTRFEWDNEPEASPLEAGFPEPSLQQHGDIFSPSLALGLSETKYA